MSGFRTVPGFDEVWRPPVGGRRVRPEDVLGATGGGADARARLWRLVRRAPEVMVKVTGRTRDPAHLAAHLSYITRNGELEAEGRDGLRIAGRDEVLDLARGWVAVDLLDPRRRESSPMSVAIILSMPKGTDAVRLRDAASAFATGALGDRHDYLLVLHTDADHPHVHLTVRARGDHGERLNPKKADLEAWRQRFARELRDREIEAEATPRRTRGITRKPERTALRKLRERFEAGRGAMSDRQRSALHAAARVAFGGDVEATAWERKLLAKQASVRRLYLAQAKLLQASTNRVDRDLGRQVEAFVRNMPQSDTQRLELARALRGANERSATPTRYDDPGRLGERNR